MKVKVGDLIRWKGTVSGDVGIVTEVWNDDFVDAIFPDGEHCVDTECYEVISEG